MPLSNDSQKIIQEQYKTLPKDVQKAILSVDLNKNLEEISRKHNLRIDQMTALENETLFIMLGLEHPSSYVTNLKKEASVDEETARAIAEEINIQIFRPIRESLKKIHEIGGGDARFKMQDSGDTVQYSKNTIQDTGRLIEHEGFHGNEVASHEQSTTRNNAPSNLPVGPLDTTQNEGGDLTAEELLKEIEGHINGAKHAASNQKPATTNIVEQKLQSAFNLPKTEREHETSPRPEEKTRPKSDTDPYREQLE